MAVASGSQTPISTTTKESAMPPVVDLPEAQGAGGPDGVIPTTTSTSPGTATPTSVTEHESAKLPKEAKEEKPPPTGLTDQTNYLPKKQVIMVYSGLSVALMCSFLDQTIVATALPRIASDLHSGKQAAWVATAYLLTSLAFTPIYGRWSDVFGRKIVLIVALSIFFIFSLACAVAQTMLQLIIFRALQGIGGGAIITMTLIIISDIVSLEDRGKYQGINEAVIAISNGVGPVLGGVFSQYTTWRWAFWINLPLTGIAIAVSIWLLPLKAVKGNAREKLLKIDYVGSGLTILGWVLILLGINWGGVTYPWTSGAVLAPLLLGVATIAVFMLWEAKFAQLPIVPVHIFKYKTVVGVYLCTAMNGMTFFTVLYYVPQFLQLVRGYNSVTASLLTLPILAPVAVFVFISGQIVARTGQYRALIIGGYMVWTISQGLQSTIDRYTSPAKIAGFLLIGGVGSGFTFQTSLLAAQAAVPRHEMAVVTGVRNFLRLLGSTLALAIAGALVNNALRSALSPLGLSAEEVNTLLDNPTAINDPSFRDTLTIAQRDAVIAGYSRGFKSVFYMTVTCMVIATLSAVFLIGHHDLKRSDDQKLKEESIQRLQDKKMKRKGGGLDTEKGQKEGAGAVADVVHALSDEKEHVEAPGSTSHRP